MRASSHFSYPASHAPAVLRHGSSTRRADGSPGWHRFETTNCQTILLFDLTGDTGVVKLDPWLAPFSDALKRRYSKAQDWIKVINDNEGGFDKFSKVWKLISAFSAFPFLLIFFCFSQSRIKKPLNIQLTPRTLQGTDIFGFNVDEKNNIIYREWAPNAEQAYLIGDFSKPLLSTCSLGDAIDTSSYRWLEHDVPPNEEERIWRV